MDGALTGMIVWRIKYSTWVVSEVPRAGSGVVGAAPCTWPGGLPEESRHEVNLHTIPSGFSAVCGRYIAFLVLIV